MTLRLSAAVPTALFPVLLGYPVAAQAQSAADMATARQLATEAIKLYREEKYEASLERMQRAQSLYDAPVHLLYIARAQAKLGQLVEAAESYQRLSRVRLEDNAPPAFKSAVETAKPELAELEPRIPKLRIVVTPPNPAGLELTLDGQPLSSAVVDIDRPANPGEHQIVAKASGFADATANVTLEEGASEVVELALEPGAGTAEDPSDAASPPEDPRAPAPGPRSDVGFFVGLRVGAGVPFGTLSTREIMPQPNPDEDIATSDFMAAGAGLELRAGARFWRHYHALVFYEGFALKSGKQLDDVRGYGAQEVTVTSVASAQSAGLGFMYKSGAPNEFGFFGEIDLAILHSFAATQDVELANASAFDESCAKHQNTLEYSGTALRLGGGVNVPLGSWFELSPFMMLTFGQFTNFEATTSCNDPSFVSSTDPSARPFSVIPASETRVEREVGDGRSHGMFFIGVGGALLLGGDK